ncbi:MAG: hypothetical protein JWR84_3882, partial [Caulobacter sp.]|nr:hypothetical protein [Caulobacter sp.]
AARAAEPAMARRVARLHADWRRGLAGCRLDVGQLGPESLVDENLCRLNFTVERQVALEDLRGQGRGEASAP